MTPPSVVDVPSRRRSREEVEGWLTTQIAAAANVPPDQIDARLPIADFDIDSSVIVSLTQGLSEWLEQDLPVTTLWEHPSIESLAAVLGTDDEGTA